MMESISNRGIRSKLSFGNLFLDSDTNSIQEISLQFTSHLVTQNPRKGLIFSHTSILRNKIGVRFLNA